MRLQEAQLNPYRAYKLNRSPKERLEWRASRITAQITRRGVVAGILLLASSAGTSAQQDQFILTIARKYKSPNCTSGYFAVNGKVVAYALELPWHGNKPLISSIPDGTYGAVLRYDHPDKWRIELTGVPGRSYVQIHTGNTTADSEGCILLGAKLGDDLCSVIDSKKAYAKLRKAFYGSKNPMATPNKVIMVRVES